MDHAEHDVMSDAKLRERTNAAHRFTLGLRKRPFTEE